MLKPGKEALIVIDVQKGFINKNTKKVVNYITSRIDSHSYDCVIATQFVNNDESMFVKQLKYTKNMSDDEVCLDVSIAERADFIIRKDTYSPDEELYYYLKDNNIKRVTIVGIDTDGCVLSTMYLLFDLGIEVFVDILGCASTGGAKMHNHAVEIMKRSFGIHHVLNA